MKYHHTRGTLTPENLLELDPRKDQLGAEHKRILLDPKTKAWVDEQNRMSKRKDTWSWIDHIKRLKIPNTQIPELT